MSETRKIDVIIPVSYTHLDVYKRQNPKNEAFMNMTLNELVRIKEMWNI